MADWFDQNMLPASVRNGYGHAAGRAAGDAAKAAEANAWTKMAERRQGFVNAGIPGRKAVPAPGMRRGTVPARYPEDAAPGPHGVVSLVAPALRLASNLSRPLDAFYDYNAKRDKFPRIVPGNPRRRNVLTEWADLMDPPYQPKSIPGIENIKRPDIRYRGPEQISGLLPGHVGQMLAKNKK